VPESSRAAQATMRFLTAVGILLMAIALPLLIYGLLGPTIEYSFTIHIFAQPYAVLYNVRTLVGKHGLVQWLWRNESYWGWFFLTTFGIVLPVMKYATFAFWLSGLGNRAWANWCVSLFQRLGKWAAVDAVCSATTVGMLLKIPSASASHGPAYLSFIMYCILSTIAFQCLPGELEADDPTPTPLNLKIASKLTNNRVRAGVLVISLASFLMLLTMAGGSHTVRMWVPKETVKKEVDHLIKKLEKQTDKRLQEQGNLPFDIPKLTPQLRERIQQAVLNLPEIDSKVSVSGNITRLLHSSHKYSIYGSLVLCFCIIFLPVVYAVLSAAKALSMTEWNEFQTSSRDPLTSIPEDQSVKGNTDDSPWNVIDKFRAFARDLSMLDVLAVGLFVGDLVTKNEHALKTSLEPQFGFLVLAAIAWHFHNFLCSCIQASAHCEYNKEPEAEAYQHGSSGSTGGVY